MATRPLRSSTETQRRAASAAAHASQVAQQQTAQQQEISARDAKRAPPKPRSTKKRTHAETQQPEGSTEDADMLQEEQQEEGAGNAQDSGSAALQRRVEELALLVQQQAQQAEEQRKARAEQDKLIAQLRASSVLPPQHPAPASQPSEQEEQPIQQPWAHDETSQHLAPAPPARKGWPAAGHENAVSPAAPAHGAVATPGPSPTGHASPKRGLALHESARAAAAAVQEQAAAASSQSRFARKEPRAQDLGEYNGASGAKLDDWLDELGAAVELYQLLQHEAVAFAASRLRDAARLWWNALGSEGKRAISSAEQLAAAMRARFQPITAAHTARVQLDKLQQGSRSINEYIADFQRLRTRLPSMAEDDALHAFKRGLRADISSELRKQRVTTLADAIDLAAHVGSEAAPQQNRQSLHQMDVDDGSASRLDRIEAALNALSSAHGNAGMGAKTQTQRGYSQERERRGGGRGGRGGQSGGGGGRFGMRSGPPVVPGVPEQVVRDRYHAQQCMRCGQDGHRYHTCPNAISASGN
jgi:hypothetical protein